MLSAMTEYRKKAYANIVRILTILGVIYIMVYIIIVNYFREPSIGKTFEDIGTDKPKSLTTHFYSRA